MAVQYIKNEDGENTGVFIPINEWKSILELLKTVSTKDFQPQDWHEDIVNERLELYQSGKLKTLDLDDTLDELEKGLK